VKKKGIKIVYLPAGHSLTPGFTDAHAHPLEYGYSRRLPLAGTKSIEEIVAKVEEYVKARGGIPEGEWVVGMGWDQTKWPVQEFPTAVS
jgi:predicted amidohydrolase YtcJ